MDPIVMQRISEMSHVEKTRLLGELKAAIAEELASGGAGEPGACPRCGSPRFVRKGHGRDGTQRWLCRTCSRTFSAATGGRGAMTASLHSYRPCPIELGHTAPRRGVDPLDTSKYILAARSALDGGIFDE